MQLASFGLKSKGNILVAVTSTPNKSIKFIRLCLDIEN
jgi:hypothetical protein